MLDDPLYHLQDAIHSARRLISSYFKKEIHFSKLIQLSEADRRNLILRLVIDSPTTNMPSSIILKQTVLENKDESEKENLSRFAKDWAGIEFLTQIGNRYAPVFYAGSLEHKFILIEDLGEKHPSLVGPLTRAPSSLNRKNALEALESYVRTLGKMHADTAGKSSLFNPLLKNVYAKAENTYMQDNDIENILAQFQKLINVDNEAAVHQEIQAIYDFVNQSNDFNVLLHGDICPDNVYFQNNHMHLIDFEYCGFGNALIDGVYLRMCMPSCWCAKAVPASVLMQLEAIYRNELKKKIPAAADDTTYFKNQVFACAYWVIQCINTLDKFELLDHDLTGSSGPVDPDSLWDPEKNTSRPRILSRLQAFISVATEHDLLPHFRKAVVLLLAYLKQAWPATDFIELYPVFADKYKE